MTVLHEILPGLLWQSAAPDNYDVLPIDVIINVWKPVRAVTVAPPPQTACYHAIPMTDSRREIDYSALARAVSVAWKALRAGKRTLVHCQGGKNRSGLVTAFVVHQVTGCTAQEALARVRAAVPGALENPLFAAYVLQHPCRCALFHRRLAL